MPEKEEKNSTLKELLPPGKSLPKEKPSPKKLPTKNSTKKTIPNTTQEKIEVEKPKYEYMGKISLQQMIKENISKEFIPTDRFASILGIIFLAVVILALIQFPFGRLLAGDVNIVTGIGWPWHFLELKIMNPGGTPLLPMNLLLDMILYLFLSYSIDVLINFISNTRIIKSKEELREKPKVYKNMNSSMADKITKKLFEKENNKTKSPSSPKSKKP